MTPPRGCPASRLPLPVIVPPVTSLGEGEASSIAGGIARESRDYDLVVLRAAREPFLLQVMFGEIPEEVARYSPASVLVVKRYGGHVRSLLRRALG